MFRRYVDNSLVILREMNRGWEYSKEKKKLVHLEKAAYDDMECGKRTFNILNDINNSLDEDIQFTSEVPSDFEDKRQPVLHITTWVDKEGYHFFYKKKITLPYFILFKSAVSSNTKRNSFLW